MISYHFTTALHLTFVLACYHSVLPKHREVCGAIFHANMLFFLLQRVTTIVHFKWHGYRYYYHFHTFKTRATLSFAFVFNNCLLFTIDDVAQETVVLYFSYFIRNDKADTFNPNLTHHSKWEHWSHRGIRQLFHICSTVNVDGIFATCFVFVRGRTHFDNFAGLLLSIKSGEECVDANICVRNDKTPDKWYKCSASKCF